MENHQESKQSEKDSTQLERSEATHHAEDAN